MRHFYASTMLLSFFLCVASMPAQVFGQPQEHQSQSAESDAPKAIEAFDNESPLLAVKMRDKTSSLQIASLFHHRANTEPDFKTWTENNQDYIDALEIDKKEVFTKAYNRFVRAFHEIDKDMIINVQTRLPLGEYSALQSIQVMDMLHEKTFFRYDAYGEYFALIPNDIKRFQHIRMTPERQKAFRERNGARHEVMAEIYLKLQKIDATKPQELEEGKKFWLMLGDIAEIRFWSLSKEDPKLLWRYQADWYDGYVDAELMNLYSGQNNQGLVQ